MMVAGGDHGGDVDGLPGGHMGRKSGCCSTEHFGRTGPDHDLPRTYEFGPDVRNEGLEMLVQ